jgi:hypothetical protein
MNSDYGSDMMKSRKSTAIKRNNQASNSKVTRENTMSPEDLAPKDIRINIRIPEKAKLFKYLTGDNQVDDRPAWKQLDAIFAIAQQNIEVYEVKLYDEFVARAAIFHPEKIEALNKLRPLIIKHIFRGYLLDEEYYKLLRDL